MIEDVVTLADVRAAAQAIKGQVDQTPLMHSRKLSDLSGASVFLKLENLQFTGSFKERGAINRMRVLSDAQRKQGVIAQSAGNHAQGVACHAERLGIPAVIVMPQHTPSVKVERTRAFGAEVILHGDTLDETSRRTRQLAEERDLTLIHPYDDPHVIAGQGTIGLEMLDAASDLDTLIVPIGGGGMISGIAIAARALRPDLSIIGVQTERFPAMYQALHGEEIQCSNSTIAEGIAVKEPGELTQQIISELVDDIVLVDEEGIEDAVLRLLQLEKLVAEGAGAAGLAALLTHRKRFRSQNVGIVICGGNIDLLILSSIIQRGLARTSRMVRLHVEIRDVPGSLGKVLQRIGEVGGNVVEVQHQRTFTTLPVQTTEVEIVLTTLGPEHVQRIMSALQSHGYKARVLERNGARAV
jgi:threonine dehydratase